jgi:hypothetical protein
LAKNAPVSTKIFFKFRKGARRVSLKGHSASHPSILPDDKRQAPGWLPPLPQKQAFAESALQVRSRFFEPPFGLPYAHFLEVKS